MFESFLVFKRGRGRLRREFVVLDSISIGCIERYIRRFSIYGKNDDEFVFFLILKRGRGRFLKCFDGIFSKGLDRKLFNNEVILEKKIGVRGRFSKFFVRYVLRSERKFRELFSIKKSRFVRRKKGVNLEYLGVIFGVIKRNVILLRKFKVLRDSKIKK